MLKLTKDKKIISDAYEKKEVTRDNILKYVFSEPVGEIDGWTLKDLMEFIAEPWGMFFGEVAWCDFDAFYQEMHKPAKKRESEDPVQYIMVTRRVSIYEGVISEYNDVYGGNDTYTDAQLQEIYNRTGEFGLSNKYAIEFTPVNELADKPIRISDKFDVRSDMLEDGTEPIVFSATKPFYLLDIIWAILWEISFAGSPEQRDEEVAELERRMKSVEDGTATLIPAEEVFERLRQRIDDLIKPQEEKES